LTHRLTGSITTGYGTDAVTRYFCDCGHWNRTYAATHAPDHEEVASEWEEHRQHAAAEDLRTAATKPTTPPATLDALVAIARALADTAKAGVAAAEALQEFVDAHKEATDRGIGVTVARQPDGSLTSTPNVFVPAGTAIFMERDDRLDYLPPHLTKLAATLPDVA